MSKALLTLAQNDRPARRKHADAVPACGDCSISRRCRFDAGRAGYMPRPSIDKLRNRHLLLLDGAFAALVPALLYCLRFEGVHWPPGQLTTVLIFTALTVPIRLGVYYAFGMYRQLWRFAGIAELEVVFLAGLTAALVSFIVG